MRASAFSLFLLSDMLDEGPLTSFDKPTLFLTQGSSLLFIPFGREDQRDHS